uniref:Uncharacterized protein n=1 Tax=Rhabditophanes sp. KR3021 TaxID=114890 RepID=A0AC35TTI5_9BILA
MSRPLNPESIRDIAASFDWAPEIKSLNDIDQDFELFRLNLHKMIVKAKQLPGIKLKRLSSDTEDWLKLRNEKFKYDQAPSSLLKIELAEINKMIKLLVKDDLDIHRKKIEAIILRKIEKLCSKLPD